ncbi:histone-like nucleoid-structuring protein Lsr2 [Rhodococcoides kyotonense]|uniref:Lsr2 protein n=1 Tax=Rhodococcoides kyotonense TaxID=398843 RepID=A0A239LQI4_9NOCA|nr:Lsr2 family protein [Rhodococcus kyotonensis]SNT32816.1 Lsr2 protein [Rhodococcus kyotonensis]
MAKKVYVQLVDDIDDKPIESGGEHITFSVNGVSYEIDLSDKNAKEFHRKLNYYIEHSARIGSKRTKKSVGTATAAIKRDANQTKAIREWAKANGYSISARGRIPADVEHAFDAAH